jgi:branched-chain amino acid transport system substrate-binding protein
MNGANAYHPYSTSGPVTYSKTDRAGVDMLQIYSVQGGVFKAVGQPLASEYMKKIK